MKSSFGWLLLTLTMISAAHGAGELPATCAGSHEIKSKSRTFMDGGALMTHLLVLQGQGEAKFHVAPAAPAKQCLAEEFELGGYEVSAIHAPFEKGTLTRNWLFVANGATPREIQVVYDGTTSLATKKEVFLVVEERDGKIAHYAMFRDPPTLAALKPVIAGILDGTAQPLSVVRWPAGAVEPVMDTFDSKRLK